MVECTEEEACWHDKPLPFFIYFISHTNTAAETGITSSLLRLSYFMAHLLSLNNF